MKWSSFVQFLRTAKIHTAIGWLCGLTALLLTGVPGSSTTAIGLESSAVTDHSVTLAWSAVGDDGFTGSATAYDVRYATFIITNDNFEAATPVVDIPTPRPAGADELIVVTGLEPSTRYYFAIKVRDDAENWSTISNVVVRVTAANLPAIANLEAENGSVGLSAQSGAEPATTSTAIKAGTSEDAADGLPGEFKVSQNYPNPFNPATTIKYSLPQGARVTICVYNELGQRVIKLFDGEQGAGEHRVEWNGADRSGRPVAAGVYFYRVVAGGKLKTKKMILLK